MKKSNYIKQQAITGVNITLEHLELMALQEVRTEINANLNKNASFNSQSITKVDTIPLMKLLAFISKIIGSEMPTMGNVHDELFDINEEEDIMSKNLDEILP